MAGYDREKLSIPCLSVEDAVSLISSLYGNKMILSEDDIRRPQYQTLRKFYTNLLIDQLEVSQEQLSQPHFNSMATFEYQELHEESASLFIFTLALQRFMFACGVEDFTFYDILAPKPKRTLYCISAVLNFIKFKNFKVEFYDKATEEVQSREERGHNGLERNAVLRQRIQQLRVQRAEEEVQSQQIMPAVESLQATITELNREQAAETKEYQHMKTTNAELASKKAELNVAQAGQKEECDNLKSKIVQSPDRFKAEMSRLIGALQSAKNSIDERNERGTELANQKDGRIRHNENVQTALEWIKSIGAEIDKERETLIRREAVHDKTWSNKEGLKDLTVKIQHCKRQGASKQDKASRITRQHEKKFAAIVEQNHHLKKDEANFVGKDAEELIASSKDMDRKIKDIVNMIEDKENQAHEEITTLQNAYSKLLDQLDLYHGSLNKAWAKVSQAV